MTAPAAAALSRITVLGPAVLPRHCTAAKLQSTPQPISGSTLQTRLAIARWCRLPTTSLFQVTIPSPFNLVVQVGVRFSTPDGIACNTNCSNTFAAGTPVTLHASSTPGSSFAGWSNGVCSGTGDCLLVLNTDMSVTANFSHGVVLRVKLDGFLTSFFLLYRRPVMQQKLTASSNCRQVNSVRILPGTCQQQSYSVGDMTTPITPLSGPRT